MFNNISTSSNNENESFSLEKYQELIDKLCPVLYYGTSVHIEKGTLYLCKETDLNPEYIILNPEDFDNIKKQITGRRLVHLKDEPFEEIRERLINNIAKSFQVPNKYFGGES